MQPDQIPTPGSVESGVPLVEGVDPSWNNVLSAVPEDKRAEIAGQLRERDKTFNDLKTSYEPWQNFSSNGISPDDAEAAINIMASIEHQPHLVYEALQKHLGLTPQEAKQVMEENTNPNGEQTEQFDLSSHPEFTKVKQQAEAAAQILLANREAETKAEEQRKEDEQLEKDLGELKKVYGDFPEDEVVMRMYAKGLSAEDAYKEFATRLRPNTPYVLGGGGQVPRSPVDVKKLDNKGTKSLVEQMLAHSQQERQA